MKMKHVANRRRSVSSRAFIALLALVLVIGCVAGGTVAWLVAKTEPFVNTFTGMSYEIADDWTELESGVYYRLVDAVTADTSFAVIKGNEITVSSDLTKENIPTANPTLKITAYAVQKENIPTAADAWAKVTP